MFFKRKAKDVARQTLEPPWDEKTMDHFTKSERFNVQITSVTKVSGFGSMPHGPIREPVGFEVSGIITWPKLILVEVTFDQRSSDELEFGFWFYNLLGKPESPQLPCLELCLADPERRIREALFETHKDALISRRQFSMARFWKRQGDGVMTAKDREDGYSSESRYPLLGVYTWSEWEASTLPNWAVPYSSNRFSVENLPARRDLKL
jgi:hypothetical protein